MYHIVVYVPGSHLEAVKTALFNAGAGQIGQYDHCSWQVLGEGQFRPLAQSNPYTGLKGEETFVAEYRLEMVCAVDYIAQAIQAMKTVHPYETPAYSFWEAHP